MASTASTPPPNANAPNGHRPAAGLLLPSLAARSRPNTASSSTAVAPRPPTGLSVASSHYSHAHTAERALDDGHDDGITPRKSHSLSVSSHPHTVASSRGSVSPDHRDRHRAVRTLPPWVQSAHEDDDVDSKSLLLPRTPTSIRPASHNHMPTPKANAVPGRHFDHVREGTPVTITSPVSEHASKWQQFARAADHDVAKPPPSRGHIVDDEWMKENMPDLETPWEPIDKDDREQDEGFWLLSASKRRRRVEKAHRLLMNHPMVPLVIRLIVFTFSTLALGLAGSIFKQSKHAGCVNNSSTWLALIVDVVAIAYTVYITYDEYTSRPLGLRSHNAKMRLIFLDLLFIVFDSANLSLAFQALTDDRWACRAGDLPDTGFCPFDTAICQRQKALTATLLIALVAWICTFAISTLRLIERVAR